MACERLKFEDLVVGGTYVLKAKLGVGCEWITIRVSLEDVMVVFKSKPCEHTLYTFSALNKASANKIKIKTPRGDIRSLDHLVYFTHFGMETYGKYWECYSN